MKRGLLSWLKKLVSRYGCVHRNNTRTFDQDKGTWWSQLYYPASLLAKIFEDECNFSTKYIWIFAWVAVIGLKQAWYVLCALWTRYLYSCVQRHKLGAISKTFSESVPELMGLNNSVKKKIINQGMLYLPKTRKKWM